MVSGKHKKSIAAVVPNVLGFSPGQRVRIELWAKALEDAGWNMNFFPFEDSRLHEVMYSPGNAAVKLSGLIRCYRGQFNAIGKAVESDVVFIYREAALVGPALLERLIARRRPIVFDIDDPVFLPYKSPTNNWASLLKFSRKTHSIFRLSTHVIAINNLIGDYARKYNPNVTVVPNCIDTERYFPKASTGSHEGKPIKLVWIGSRSTMPNLVEIAGPIRRLQEINNSSLLVIGAGDAGLSLKSVETRQWSAETEITDLQEGDIGLLPLNDLNWNHWKFFFKAIQYMAVGIPVVARRMGSNSEVIQDGVTGFLVETEEEWFERLKLLTTDHQLRKQMGVDARRVVEERFSLKTQMPRVVEVFEQTMLNRKLPKV